MSSWILTYTNRQFDVLNPRVEDVDIRDIARALSHACRFAGHVDSFYSVAEHSCYVSALVPPEHALQGLLHDASEAYLNDIPAPIKKTDAFAPYRELEAQVQSVIFRAFGVPEEIHPAVHDADYRVVANEARELFTPIPEWTRSREHFPDLIVQALAPEQARRWFLNRFKELTA